MWSPAANFREDNAVKYVGVFGGLTAQANMSLGIGATLPQVALMFRPPAETVRFPGSFAATPPMARG